MNPKHLPDHPLSISQVIELHGRAFDMSLADALEQAGGYYPIHGLNSWSFEHFRDVMARNGIRFCYDESLTMLIDHPLFSVPTPDTHGPQPKKDV